MANSLVKGTCLLALWCNLSVHPPAVQAEPSYSYHQLADLEEAMHRVASEKTLLRERAQSLIDQKEDIDTTIDALTISYGLLTTATQAQQNARLLNIRTRIKEILHRLGDAVARVADGKSVADSNQANLAVTWNNINNFGVDSHLEQDAALARANQIAIDSGVKVFAEAARMTSNSADMVTVFEDNLRSVNRSLNLRKCFTHYARVDVHPILASGSANVSFPEDFFSDNVPTVLCGIQSVTSDLQLDEQGYDYGGYSGYDYDYDYGYGYGYRNRNGNGYKEVAESSAVTVDCQAFGDRVEIRVFDQSRGRGNRVSSAYVEIKACSIPALTSVV